MQFILTALLASALVQNSDEAEQHVRNFEKKLADTKALQIAFEAVVEGLDEAGTFKGTLTVGEGNKMHLLGTIEIMGKRVDWKMVSDGNRLKEQGVENATERTPEKLCENYRHSLMHGGYVMGIFMSAGVEGKPLWMILRRGDLKLEKKENLGKREAHVVVSTLTPIAKLGGDDVSFAEKLWLDTESKLPLKRVVTSTFKGKKVSFTETYASFVLDPKIDGNLFVVPK